jgi:hypothetical protein
MITSRKLFRVAAKDYWRWRTSLWKVMIVLALPLSILGSVGGLGQDPTFSAYSSFATLALNLALLWTILRLARGQKVSIREAYYDGTAPLLRFLLLAICLALMLLPFSIGALIYISGITGTTLTATTPEKLLLGVVWAAFAVPSLYLISRYLLSIFTILEPGTGPLQALRAAGRLARRKTWRITVRIAALVVVALLILTVPTVAATASGASWLGIVALIIIQLLSTMVVLPISSMYLYRLYEDLQ